MQRYTLLDGTSVAQNELRLDVVSYHVYAGTRDITNLMRQADKVTAFPHFDRAVDNVRASDEAAIANGETPVVVGSTSLWGNFFRQIFTEPLKAPLEAVGNSFRGLSPETQAVVKVATVLLIVGGVAYTAKVIKDLRS